MEAAVTTSDQTNLVGALTEENHDLRAEVGLLRQQLDEFYRPGWTQCAAAAVTEGQR